MIGYFLLSLSLLAGATKGFCGKKISFFTKETKSAVFANMIRMLMCVVIGAVIVVLKGEVEYLIPDVKLLLVSAMSGVSTAVFVVTWLMSVRKSAYVMLELFLTMGVIIPLALSWALFGEPVTLRQRAGFIILALGVYVMSLYSSSIKGKISKLDLVLLFLCGAFNAVTDFSQKLFVKSDFEAPATVFNLYTYIFCAIILSGFYFAVGKGKEKTNPQKMSKTVFMYVGIMSLCLFAHSYFKTLAATHLDAVKLYPLSQAGSLILSTAMSAVFFGEKITLKSFLGTAIAFLGLLVINI